jgi:hypothetical protein
MTASPAAKAQLGFWTTEKSAAGVTPSSTAATDLAIQTWPNPASGLMKIEVAAPASSDLDVRLFDLTGREVKTIFAGIARASGMSFSVNLSDVPSGTYIVAARVPGELVEKQISIMH